MRRRYVSAALASSILLLFFAGGASAQPDPYPVIAAAYEPGFGYLTMPDAYGGNAQPGWIWHLVLDRDGDGLAPPVLEGDDIGQPGEDDLLLAVGRLGDGFYLPDSLMSVAVPVTSYPVRIGLPLFLRLFAADSLAPGVAFGETPGAGTPLPAEAFAIANLFLPPPRGGLLPSRLEPGGLPAVAVDSVGVDPFAEWLVLEIPGTATAAFHRVDGTSLTFASLRLYEGEPAGWNLSEPPLPRCMTLMSFSPYDILDPPITLDLSCGFRPGEVDSLYGGEVEPDHMTLYKETPEGWVEVEGTVVESDPWRVSFESFGQTFSGRFAIAPDDLTSVPWDRLASAFPTRYYLYPVYPSPFNSTARVRLDLPRASPVRLEVFNILGQRVAVLSHGVLPAGSHAFTFAGNHLASGLYLLRVRAGGYESTRKVMLIR